MENSKQMPVVVEPGNGNIFSVMGGNYRVLISGKQTNGAFATIEMLVPPEKGPGPHSHASFYESFYIVDGEVEVSSEAGSYIAKKGAFVVIPEGGVVHSFKNVGNNIANLLCTVVPAGLDAFIEEFGEPVAPGEFLPMPPMNPEAMQKLKAIAQKHGQEVYPPDFLKKK